MGGLGIGDITQGYSKMGVENFKADLNSKAITETINLLNDTKDIRNALEAGWQGQSLVAFEANLDKAVNEVSTALENLKTTMDTEFDNIVSSIADFDNSLITEE